MTHKPIILLSACAIALGGCSSRPRNFAPVLGAPAADPKAYEAHWLDCREQVAAATGKGSGRLASAGGGAVAGAGAGVAASAVTSGATFGTYGAAAAAGAAMIAMVPVFGLAGAWGISKIKKSKKERTIKTATAQCMTSKGYSVEKWRVMSKREVRALEADVQNRQHQRKPALVEASATEPAGPESP